MGMPLVACPMSPLELNHPSSTSDEADVNFYIGSRLLVIHIASQVLSSDLYARDMYNLVDSWCVKCVMLHRFLVTRKFVSTI